MGTLTNGMENECNLISLDVFRKINASLQVLRVPEKCEDENGIRKYRVQTCNVRAYEKVYNGFAIDASKKDENRKVIFNIPSEE